MPSATGNSAIEDLLFHRGVKDQIYFRAFGVGAGDQPRKQRFQWNVLSDPAPTKPLLMPETHSRIASIPFWRDEVLQGR
jgi:hypothetical protein